MNGDSYKREESSFGVELACFEVGQSERASIQDVGIAERHLADVQKHMKSKGDIADIYGAVRQKSGLKFENWA